MKWFFILVALAVVAVLVARAKGVFGHRVPDIADLTAAPAPSLSSPDPALSFDQQVEQSKKHAIEHYPELAQAGTPLNARFVEQYKVWRARDDSHLQMANWPEQLANECAKTP